MMTCQKFAEDLTWKSNKQQKIEHKSPEEITIMNSMMSVSNMTDTNRQY